MSIVGSKAHKGLIIPHFLKKALGILQSPPSVHPSRYLLLNHWMKSNQIWCVSCSHEWGVQRHFFFWPRHLGPWGGTKRSNIIKFQLQRFFNQTLCVFSHMKNIKHIFGCLGHTQGSDLGVPWGVWGGGGGGGGQIFFFEILPVLVCELLT